MGRYYWDKKTEADGLKKIEMSFLKKHGYLNHSRWDGQLTWTHGGSDTKSSIGIASHIEEHNNFVTLNYTQTDRATDEKKEFDYQVRLTTTPCNYGGKRYWFICPLVTSGRPCGRRVSVIYKGGDHFGCRHCFDLSYESRNETYARRHPAMGTMDAFFKIEKLEEQVKRRFYAGKPTRKYKRILKLERIVAGYSMADLEGDLLSNMSKGQ
jgi:hypothetical protein